MRTWARTASAKSTYVSTDGWRIEGIARSDRGDRDWILTSPTGQHIWRTTRVGERPFATLAAAKAAADQNA